MEQQKIITNFKCDLCEKEFDNVFSLSKHSSRIHKITSKNLYIKIFCNGIEPTCKCGCGQQVKFISVNAGFKEYKVGHIARIKNNFNTEKSTQNSLNTRKKMIADGIYKPFINKETGKHWCEGLTIETDERLRIIGQKNKNNKIAHEKMSEIRRRKIKNGEIIPLKGDQCYMWKGGISALNAYSRVNNRLYTEWKYPILKEANFICQDCGKGSFNGVRLHVHHDKEEFSEILRKVAYECGWNENLAIKLKNPTKELIKLKEEISNKIVDYHVEYKVSGLVLCLECHKKLHNGLNLK